MTAILKTLKDIAEKEHWLNEDGVDVIREELAIEYIKELQRCLKIKDCSKCENYTAFVYGEYVGNATICRFIPFIDENQTENERDTAILCMIELLKYMFNITNEDLE